MTSQDTGLDHGRATSIDMDATTAAALGYLLSVIAAIVVFGGDERNDFVRFHVLQAVLYTVASAGIWMGLFLIGMVFGIVTLGFGMIIVAPLMLALVLPMLGYPVYAAIRAADGEWYEMPVLADIAYDKM